MVSLCGLSHSAHTLHVVARGGVRPGRGHAIDPGSRGEIFLYFRMRPMFRRW